MAEEGFEGYHIPQQSRREKLREVGSAQNHPPCVQTQTSDHHHLLLPLYDPTSYISTTELTREFHHNHHHQHRSDSLTSPDESCKTRHHPAGCSNIVKEEGVNLMGFMGGSCLINNSSNATASSSTSPDQLQHHPYNYLDPRSSANLPLNPTSIHDVNNSPFIFSPQTLQNLDHSTYNGVHDQLVVFRPETLSLSLSSSSHPFDLNLQKYGSAIYSTPPHDDIVLASATNVGPFTAYVSVLKGSRFFKPAQQLLEELCDVGIHGIYSEKIVLDSSLIDPPLETFSSCAGHGIVDDGGENGRKKSRLISMLDEVYTKYKQYCQQIQAIVASFEYVSGLGNAALYAYLAVKTMSKQFRCLKNAITEQLQFPNKASGQQYQRSLHNTGFLEHQPVWRPQRGLPERAVSVLRAWLFEHFLHPYPTDTDKLMLAKQTGLSRNQVSNWFINARVRLWKPMVEEIHMLETRQAEKSTHRPDELLNTDLSNNVNGTPPSAVSLASEYLHSGSKRHILQDTRNQNHHHHHHDMTSNISSQSDVGVRTTSTASRGAGNGSGVSLTLGLHQNNSAMGLSEPLPIHAAGQNFGLDMNGDHHHHAGGYNIMNGFELQNRHFGRNLGGGQLLHDFVG